MTTFPNLIGGEWTMGTQQVPNVNPSDTNDIIGEAASATADEMNRAIELAAEAQISWGASTPQTRFDILDAIGTDILARKDELGDLLSREEGKTLAEGIGEVMRAGQIFKFFAGEALRIPGERLDSIRPGVDVDMRREPVGVIGLITPWNFPIAIPAWKIAPALAYGNAVILKAAEAVPGSAWALAEIIEKSGLPKGVFNLVNGRGSEIGPVMIEHPKVQAISFTGSVQTGRAVAQACAKHLKKVQLEMGGKNPMVVLDDADLDIAVNTCVNGAFFSTGQRCTASSRMIVTKGIYDKFVDAMINAVSSLKVGDARDASTQIGPVIDERQLEKDLEYIDIAKAEGAKLACGGAKIDGKGHYMSPALFIDTTNDMRINREEIFGPVATIIKANDYEEALAIANDTEFGLSAGICTTSLKYASDFKARAKAGMVMVNLPTAGVDYHVPFGGAKGSSYGSREQGRYAVEFYTAVKTSYTQA
ncbi:aldehyde dehydrogenase family protein [Terasakiella sp. A23]|uniref:aldehyde dehydrogenase family protein n=1 Tax=Terasakiella sp. FCG-A23 TaxID=3080561 RepID=UPI002954B29B|nr:aldehyde dehydrogenase family protein [Terasakiella sp. A23]MDV7341240.1 aldehyde dehydrogenase family protein [Terasakiella sp. A23]